MKFSFLTLVLLVSAAAWTVEPTDGRRVDSTAVAHRRTHHAAQHVLDASVSTDRRRHRLRHHIGAKLSPEPNTVDGSNRTWWIFKTTKYPKISMAVPNRSFPVGGGTSGDITVLQAQLWATGVDSLLNKIFAGDFGADAKSLLSDIDTATPAHATTAPLLTNGPDANLLILMKHQACNGNVARGGASPHNGPASMDKTGSSAKFDYNPCAYGKDLDPPTIVLHEAIHALHSLRGVRDKSCGWPPSGASCCCEEYRTVGLHGDHVPQLPNELGGKYTENKIRAQRRTKSGKLSPADRTDYDGCAVDKVDNGQCTEFWK